MVERGLPQKIRSDNRPEFVTQAIRSWLTGIGVSTLFIGSGAPWENAYTESFNARLRDELLDGELFTSLDESRCLLARWRVEYNIERPHCSLGKLPPWSMRRAVRPPTPLAPSPAAQLEEADGICLCRHPLNPEILKSLELVSGDMPVGRMLFARLCLVTSMTTQPTDRPSRAGD